ncbi:hypothetical protein DRO97_10140, partial [Archaeoglobales archaeon]
MGQVYLNPLTGETWESSKKQRKPPEGFTEHIGEFNYNWRTDKYTKIFKAYCKDCHRWHGEVTNNNNENYYYYDFIEKYGCKTKKLIQFVGKFAYQPNYKHYNLAEQIYQLQPNFIDKALHNDFKIEKDGSKAMENILLTIKIMQTIIKRENKITRKVRI